MSAGNPWLAARNLLAVRLDNAGDVVMLGPALRAIKTTLPDCQITLLASPAGAKAAPLLPWVDSILVWRSIWQDLGQLPFDPVRENELIQQIAERSFDAAVIFTSFSQTPHVAAYVCYLAGIPLRAGESKEFGGGTLSTELRGTPDAIHQVDRNLHLVQALGFTEVDPALEIAIPGASREAVGRHLWNVGIAPDKPFVVLHPGASAAARRYPEARFGQVADLLLSRGWPLVVTGSEGERDLLESVAGSNEAIPVLTRPVDPGVRGTGRGGVGGRLRQLAASAPSRRNRHAGRRALRRHGIDLAVAPPLCAFTSAATSHGSARPVTASPARLVCPVSTSLRKRSSRRSRRSCRWSRSPPNDLGW